MTEKTKSSIRLSLNDNLREGLDLLRRVRYPFLKDDEIFKLGFSKLFASEAIKSNKETSISNLLFLIRQKNPEFGKKYLSEKNISEEDLDINSFVELISEDKK